MLEIIHVLEIIIEAFFNGWKVREVIDSSLKDFDDDYILGQWNGWIRAVRPHKIWYAGRGVSCAECRFAFWR